MARAKRRFRKAGSINVAVDMDPSPRALAQRFDFLKTELDDMRPAWERLVPKLRKLIGKQITSQGDIAHADWPPWKPSYAKRRPAGAMLILTGRLLTAVTTRGKLSATKRALRFGVRLPYARAVYFGSKKQKIRSRPFMVATPQVVETASIEVHRRVSDVLDRFPAKTGRVQANTLLRRKQRR